MKYIDAEKLKAKLDEHYRKYQNKYMETRNPYTQGLIDALDLAEQVIDSLQQEQPQWKPSEEQMNELFQALIPGAEYDCDILQELYFGLKSWLDSIHNQQK